MLKLSVLINFNQNILEKYDNIIYVTEDNKESLKNVAKTSNPPTGLMDSIMSGAKFRCKGGVVSWTKLENECEAFQNKNPSKFLKNYSCKIFV